jgi:uncharacterized repeat protein (TIGR04076 family)
MVGLQYKVVGKIVGIKGECHAGHEVGEEIDLTIFDGERIQKGINLCPFFLDKLFPYLCVIQFGGQFPWQKEPNIWVDSCPDDENKVTIRIERIKIDNQG